MTESPLTNEQKLDEIYAILLAGERRRMRESLFHLVKWMILLGGIGYIISHQEELVKHITDMVQPMILEQSETMMKGIVESKTRN